MKRSEVILKLTRQYAIRHPMVEGKYITPEEFMKEILDTIESIGMLPPKAVIKNGKIETTDYFWESENEKD